MAGFAIIPLGRASLGQLSANELSEVVGKIETAFISGGVNGAVSVGRAAMKDLDREERAQVYAELRSNPIIQSDASVAQIRAGIEPASAQKQRVPWNWLIAGGLVVAGAVLIFSKFGREDLD